MLYSWVQGAETTVRDCPCSLRLDSQSSIDGCGLVNQYGVMKYVTGKCHKE